jgi:hypothetical protein
MLKIKNFKSFNKPHDLSLKLSPNNNNGSVDERNKNLKNQKNNI